MWDKFWDVVEWIEKHYVDRFHDISPTDCHYCLWWRGHFAGMLIGAAMLGGLQWLLT